MDGRTGRMQMMTEPLTVFVDLAGTRRLGKVCRLNTHTTWVKVMKGAKTYDYIKRHNKKHNVTMYVEWGKIPYEAFHTTIRFQIKAT
jgi:hypothetical protein